METDLSIEQCPACGMYKRDGKFFTSFDYKKQLQTGKEQRYTHPDKVKTIACHYAAARGKEGCINQSVEVTPFVFSEVIEADETTKLIVGQYESNDELLTNPDYYLDLSLNVLGEEHPLYAEFVALKKERELLRQEQD